MGCPACGLVYERDWAVMCHECDAKLPEWMPYGGGAHLGVALDYLARLPDTDPPKRELPKRADKAQ